MPTLETESVKIVISDNTLEKLEEVQRMLAEDSIEAALNRLVDFYLSWVGVR